MSNFLLLLLSLTILKTREIWANETQSQTILIELPDKFTLNELNFFQIFELEILTEHKIIIRNLNNYKNVLGLLEVHSFLYPVGLENPNGNITNGTNIGFTVEEDGEFILTNTNSFIKVEAAIALVTMNKTTSPFPSGCDESNSGPLLKISGLEDEETDIVRVSTPAASCARNDCTDTDLSYESRFKYLRVGDLSSRTYFDGIKDMVTADGARKHGRVNDLAFSDGNKKCGLKLI